MSLLTYNFDAFGLDIGDRSVKAAWIKKSAGRPRLLSYGTVAVPDGVLEKGEIKKAEVLAGLIKNFVTNISGQKIKTNYVHACLPENQTFIKLLTVVSPSADELAAKIREDLPNHFPVNPDELYLDWQTVNQTGATYKVVVAATPRALADSFTACLAAAGLEPLSLQVEAEAVWRSLLPQNNLPRSPVAILDIGATRTSFICFARGSIQFTSSLPFSGDALTALIAERLKLGRPAAEKAKIVCGLNSDCGRGLVSRIIEPAVNELAQAIKKNINFYQEHLGESPSVPELILCGGGAKLKNLQETLTEKLGTVEVAIGNPLINLAKSGELAAAVIYTTAIGLALADIL